MQLPQEQVQRIFRKIVPEHAPETDDVVLSSPTLFVSLAGQIRVRVSKGQPETIKIFLGEHGALCTQDKTGDGNLDRTEFWRFIETIGGQGWELAVHVCVCVHGRSSNLVIQC